MNLFNHFALQVCSTAGTQNWVYGIAGSEVQSLYQPWSYQNTLYGTKQHGGYLTQFSDSLSFATVHHAGHEVPAYQPESAFELFRRYLDGSLFSAVQSSGGDGGDTTSTTSSGSSSSSSSGGNGVFPDVLSEVIAILMVVIGAAGLLLGGLAYYRARNQRALADSGN